MPYNDVAVIRTFFFHLNPIYTSKTRLVKAVSLKEIVKKYIFHSIKMSSTSICNSLNLKSTDIGLRSFYEEIAIEHV